MPLRISLTGIPDARTIWGSHPISLGATRTCLFYKGTQMLNQPLLDRITIDPAICHGKPCIRHMRYPVETILELLSAGMTTDEILADYEDLEADDILAVFSSI